MKDLHRTAEEYARMDCAAFESFIAKKYGLTFDEYLNIQNWISSRMECMGQNFSAHYSDNFEERGKCRKVIEECVEDFYIRTHPFYRWRKKRKVLDPKILYAQPWGKSDEMILSDAKGQARKYGLTDGTPEYDTYLQTYLSVFKEYPIICDNTCSAFKEHEARNYANDMAEKRCDSIQHNKDKTVLYRFVNNPLFLIATLLLVLIGLITLCIVYWDETYHYIFLAITIVILWRIAKWFFGF